MAYQEGQLLGRRYRIIRPISFGGMAATYLAADTLLGERQVAVEVFQSSSKEQLQLQQSKFIPFARLDHPNILRTFDFGVEADTFYIINEYAPNGTLRQLHPRGTRIPLSTVISYVKQVASALQYIHNRGIIHRDVKPENMFVGSNNTVLLGDFGIATTISDADSDEDEVMAGTMTYMAPEQIRGKPNFASDQYALGIVAYEWLTGVRPFEGAPLQVIYQHVADAPPPLREKDPSLPLAVEAVVLKALEKDPSARFVSVQSFANALEQASAFAQRDPLYPPPLASEPPSMRLRSVEAGTSPSLPLASLPPPVGSEPRPPDALASFDEEDERYPTNASPIARNRASGDLDRAASTSAPSRNSGLPTFFTGAGDALAKFFSGRGGKKRRNTQLSLFAIARAALERDDRAIVGKVYTVQAGISQYRPENFRGEPFEVSVRNPLEPLLFHILLHPSENIELMGAWYQSLRYDPRNVEPQFISCLFRLRAPGRSYLIINFYRERQWLKSIRFEFDGIEQSMLSTAVRGR